MAKLERREARAAADRGVAKVGCTCSFRYSDDGMTAYLTACSSHRKLADELVEKEKHPTAIAFNEVWEESRRKRLAIQERANQTTQERSLKIAKRLTGVDLRASPGDELTDG